MLPLVAHNGGEANRRRIFANMRSPSCVLADEISRDIAPTFQSPRDRGADDDRKRAEPPEGSRPAVTSRWQTRSKRRVLVVGFVRETVPHDGKNEEARARDAEKLTINVFRENSARNILKLTSGLLESRLNRYRSCSS